MNELEMQVEAVEPSHEPVETMGATETEVSEPTSVGVEESESSEHIHSESETQEVSSNAENAKKRIDGKGKKLQRKIAELESRLQHFETQSPYLQQTSTEQMPVNSSDPNQVVDPITGEYLTPGTGRYEAVLLQHQQETMHQQRSQQQQYEESMRYQRQQDEKFFDALDDASEKYEDFDDVVRNDNLPLTDAMLGVAKVTPNGADLLYYMGKNPKEVQRISKLHPLVQQQEMAKHAIQFAARNQVSKAPAPVQPVGESAGSKAMNTFARVAQSPSELRKFYKQKHSRK